MAGLQIHGSSKFSIGPGAVIDGPLTIEDVTGVLGAALCASTVQGNLLILDNAIPIEIGPSESSCAPNVIGNNLVIENNSGPIDVYNNHVIGALSCRGNLSIAGAGNFAAVKDGQCDAF